MTTSTEERRRGGIATSQVEYQMKFRDIVVRAGACAADELRDRRSFGPFLTISREAGSGGAEVAQRVASRLGWAVLDKELVDCLASDLKLEPRVLKLIDETRANWFSETLLNLFNSRLVAQQSYVELLGKVVALAASTEPVVIVGRGAHLILPHEHGLYVRVIAPRPIRLTELARIEGVISRRPRNGLTKSTPTGKDSSGATSGVMFPMPLSTISSSTPRPSALTEALT